MKLRWQRFDSRSSGKSAATTLHTTTTTHHLTPCIAPQQHDCHSSSTDVVDAPHSITAVVCS